MKGEYISIETLKIWQEVEKENEELHKKINKAIEYIKNHSKCGGSFIDNKFVIEYIDEIYNGMELLNILGDSNEKI